MFHSEIKFNFPNVTTTQTEMKKINVSTSNKMCTVTYKKVRSFKTTDIRIETITNDCTNRKNAFILLFC